MGSLVPDTVTDEYILSEAERRPGQTGENLLAICESRLDNVVYRLGFAMRCV